MGDLGQLAPPKPTQNHLRLPVGRTREERWKKTGRQPGARWRMVRRLPTERGWVCRQASKQAHEAKHSRPSKSITQASKQAKRSRPSTSMAISVKNLCDKMAAMKLEDSEFPMEIDDGEDTDTESPMEVDGDKTTDVETVGIRSLIEMKAVYRHSVSGAMFDSEVRCETSSPGSSLMVTMHVICSRPH